MGFILRLLFFLYFSSMLECGAKLATFAATIRKEYEETDRCY